MATPATGRNDPCPCGSGRRYKDCHGAIGAAPPPTPDRAHDHVARARAHMGTGDLELMQRSARQATALDPRNAEAWMLLGVSLAARDPAQALRALERAVHLGPGNAEALFRLADLRRRGGDADAAIGLYEQALAIAPRHAVVLNNLGLALQAAGRADEAAQRYREAIAVAPRFMEAHANLGELLYARGDHAGAARAFAAALDTNPDVPELWSRKGLCEYHLGALDEAHASFARARGLSPGDPTPLLNMASARTAQQRYAEALKLVDHALKLAPGLAEAENVQLYLRQQLCAWEGFEALFERQRARLRAGDPALVIPHNLLALPYTPAELHDAARRWARHRIRTEARPRPPAASMSNGKLRIAYLGPDFRAHPLANLLTEVIELHDRTRFEVIGYAVGPDDRSDARTRFARAFDAFHDLAGDPSAAIAERVRADGVAILLDTSGYVLQARSDVFALRPAPLQINCIGFAGTLGAEWYDYILTDRFVTPEAEQAHFTEGFMYLPHCYMPGDRRRVMAQVPSRRACGLPDDAFVYCCFNASYKILPDMFARWMRVLARVPNGVLWLLESDRHASANLRAEARRAGVDPARIVFAPRVPLASHLARHAVADLFLDTLPYNAHTTANDALFAGLPLLTCPGETFASRVSGSHLHAIGLPELVASSLAAYESLAIELAFDGSRLGTLRKRLAEHRDTQPLFDTPAYTRALEVLLLAAWERERRSAG